MSYFDPAPETLGIAGGAIAAALLDLLIERKIIEPADARAVCVAAQADIKRRIGFKGDAASALIDEVLGTLPEI
ncbi:MAG TPA: hypothetical protein VMR17_16220 [Xanthobacteraceae bacterium]|nr:hypothetical protein [Xanthobacteraceae bacterium]